MGTPKILMWFSSLLARRKRHKGYMKADTQLVHDFKTLVAKLTCPSCNQKKLVVDTYAQDPQTFEATGSCDNCDITWTCNSYGFQFQGVNSKGRART